MLFLLVFLALPPCIFAADFGSTGSLSGGRTVQITCTAGQGYSCYSVNYSVDGNAWQHSYGSNAVVSIAGSGSHEVRYYAVGEACSAGECTYAIEPMKSISLSIAVNLELNDPNGGEFVGGIHAIDFNVANEDNSELHLKIAYSTTPRAFSNSIASDLNLNDYNSVSGLNCVDSNWLNSTNCTYNWNTSMVSDGNYFVDLNLWHSGGAGEQDSSDASFLVDNSAPSISFSSPTASQQFSAGLVPIDFNATASGAPVSLDSIQALVDGNTPLEFDNAANCTEISGGYNCSFTTIIYGNADYNLSVIAPDAAGNSGQADRAFTVSSTTLYSLEAGTVEPSTAASGTYSAFDVGISALGGTISSDDHTAKIGFSTIFETLLPDVNLASAAYGYYGNTTNIQFNVANYWGEELHAKLAYSAAGGSFQNTIVADLNLDDHANLPLLSCESASWPYTTSCTYRWDTNATPTGNYYADVNVWAPDGYFVTDSSGSTVSILNYITDQNFLLRAFSIQPGNPASSGDLKALDLAVGLPALTNTSAGDLNLEAGFVTIVGIPRVPSNPSVTVQESSLLVSWGANNNPSGIDYNVLNTKQSLALATTTDLNYTDTDYNTQNCYAVKACDWVCTGQTVTVCADIVPPFTSFTSPSGWQATDFNAVLECTDVGGTGCVSTEYRIDSGPWNVFGTNISYWQDSNWQFRRRVYFNNSGQAQKTDYSVVLRLNSGNFDFSKAQSAGQDLRFRDADQNVALQFFFDEFNATTQTATIWVKVPQIDADSISDYMWLYYGNAVASDAQSSNWFS